MSAGAPGYITGIDVPLPETERVLWQGAPSVSSLAYHAFHARKIAIYFGALLAWRALASIGEPAPTAHFAAGAVPLALLGAICVGCAIGLAHLSARTTVYAITDRRVVMKVGMVVSTLINIPFRQIEGAAHRPLRAGTGDIALSLDGEDRLAWVLLWPHARGWRLRRPEPALRSIPESARVAAILHRAVALETAPGEPAPDAAPVTVALRPRAGSSAVRERAVAAPW